MGIIMLLTSGGVFREQDEALAHLQKFDALASIVCLLCGICTGLCLIEVVALSTHVSDSTVLIWRNNAEIKRSFPLSLPRGEESE
jgi:hypothetical protein